MPASPLLLYFAVPAVALFATTTAIVSLSSAPPGVAAIEASADVEVVLQRTAKDCGLAAIATLARLLEKSAPQYAVLLRRYPPHGYGHSVDELSRIGRDLGLDLQPVRVSAAGLSAIPLPAILHLRSDHFVVLIDRNASSWQVANPARGIERRPRAIVESLFSGTALVRR